MGLVMCPETTLDLPTWGHISGHILAAGHVPAIPTPGVEAQRKQRYYPRAMNAPTTTTIEFDSDLLRRLRERTPGKSDREALEGVARIQLGFDTIRRVQERNADAGVDDDEVMAEAVRAVRESRRERAARRAAG